MNDPTIREALRSFITADLMRDPDYDLTDIEGIITGGLLDSFALAEMAVFVEGKFNVFIPDSDLTVARMDSLDQMVARVLQG